MIDKIDNADVIVIGGGLARAKKWREKREERKKIAAAQTNQTETQLIWDCTIPDPKTNVSQGLWIMEQFG